MLSKEDVLKNFLREDTEDVIKVYQAMSLAYNKHSGESRAVP